MKSYGKRTGNPSHYRILNTMSQNPENNKSNKQALALDHTAARGDFAHFHRMPLRWIDNDMYGQLNNARYYSLFENCIMHYFGVVQGLDPNAGEERCFSVENGCRYHQSVKFPDIAEIGLRVAHIGNSSVRYEMGLFVEGSDAVAATSFAVEVFVSAETEKPVRIPDKFRAALSQLIVN